MHQPKLPEVAAALILGGTEINKHDARYAVDEEAVEDIIDPSGWKAKAVAASKETSLGLWPKWFP